MAGTSVFVFFFLLFSVSLAISDEFDISLSFGRSELASVAGYGEEKLSSVLVTGTVVCNACLAGEGGLRELPVAGALVGVTCKAGRKASKLSWAKGSTDEYGDFIIDLPSHLHANPKLDKECRARVLHLPRTSPCRRVLPRKQRGLQLSSVGNGIRTYAAGKISFRRHDHPTRRMCSRKRGHEKEQRTW